MADNIALIEVNEVDAFHGLQRFHGFEQAAAPRVGQVNLRDIPRNHGLRPKSQPRDKHLHLLGSRVLSLVHDDEGIVQSPSAHESDGRDLDDVLLQVAIHLFGIEHVIQGVVQRAQVRINLVLQRAR